MYHFDNTGNQQTSQIDVHECKGSTISVVRAQGEAPESDVPQIDEESDSESPLSPDDVYITIQ